MNNELGYKVIRNFIDPDVVTVMQSYFDIVRNRLILDEQYRNKTRTTLEEGDVAYSYSLYGDYLTETTSMLYGQKLCNITGKNLSPTYTFARFYEKGNMLVPHIDRPACEYSVTIPITISDERASSIFISKKSVTWQELSNRKLSIEEARQHGEFEKVDLMPGDALFYKGTEYIHWREPLESDYLIQFFMHYVDSQGPYAEEVFDRRPYMGFPESFRGK